ncbi:MAG: APC family permease [Gammaproteobacteria bacterium]
MSSNPSETGSPPRPRLRRVIGASALTAYGVGNIVGAGIYVLVGEVAGIAGMWAPLSFVLAALIAGFSALSYGELAARYPVSAGEVVYVKEAFGFDAAAVGVGLLLVAAGTVSSAALTRGFVGYTRVLLDLPDAAVTVAAVAGLGLVIVWGVRASVSLAVALTIIEVGGLLLVLSGIWPSYASALDRMPELLPSLALDQWQVVAAGAFVALFAYLGFEDMVNMAEEVREPQRAMPVAIVVALVVSCVLYLLVVLGAVLSVAPETLAASEAPLAALYASTTGNSPAVIGFIGLAAAVNGALVQMVMVARVLYGMANRGLLPAVLRNVNARTRTPVVASLLVTLAVLALTLAFPLGALASATSLAVLLVFVLINLALLIIKRKSPVAPGVKTLPVYLPVVGFVSSAGIVLVHLAF